jgi:hypothetical protein
LNQQVDLFLALAVVGDQQRGPAQAAKFEQRFIARPARLRLRQDRFQGGEVAANFLQIGVRHGVRTCFHRAHEVHNRVHSI